jgi:site-specific DNA-methyltransferase (adenine-specific)
MEREAAAAGLFESGGQKIPKVQILTAAQVIAGQRPRLPFGHVESLKRASREREDRQGDLF